MSWNPHGVRSPQFPKLLARATLPPGPVTGIEQSQGTPYSPHQARELARPQALGVLGGGYVNPFSLTLYTQSLSTTQAIRVAPANYRRCYLVLQNQGPGNIYVCFQTDVTVPNGTAPVNGIKLVQSQFYEQIGGGDLDGYGVPRANCFVSPDYISVVADLANTSVLICEGVWRNNEAFGR
jgi:hypothetical protein